MHAHTRIGWLLLLVVACSLWLLGAGAVSGLDLPALAPDELAIAHLDVGQGMSTLIIGPETEADPVDRRVVVLVDSGGMVGRAGKDGGQVALDALRMCWARGLRRLDYFIITHHDGDHYKGALLGTAGKQGFLRAEDGVRTQDDMPIGTFIDHGRGEPKPENSREYRETVCYVRRHQQPRPALCSVTTRGRLDRGNIVLAGEPGHTARMLCVASNRYVRGTAARVPKNTDPSMYENDCSLGYLLSYGSFDYLICGDAGTGVEAAIARYLAGSAQDAGVDALNVSHHGSAGSTSGEPFLKLVGPEVAVISVGGPDSSDTTNYKHPRYTVLSALAADAHLQAIYQTGAGVTVRGENQVLPAALKVGCRDVVIITNGRSYRVHYFDSDTNQYQTAGPFATDNLSPPGTVH